MIDAFIINVLYLIINSFGVYVWLRIGLTGRQLGGFALLSCAALFSLFISMIHIIQFSQKILGVEIADPRVLLMMTKCFEYISMGAYVVGLYLVFRYLKDLMLKETLNNRDPR